MMTECGSLIASAWRIVFILCDLWLGLLLLTRETVRGGSVVCKRIVRVFCVGGGEARLKRGMREGCVRKLFLGACQVWG